MAAGKSCHHADSGQLQLKIPVNPVNKSQGRRSSQARLNIQKIEPSDNVNITIRYVHKRKDGNIQRK